MRNQVREQRTQRKMSQAAPLAFAIARFFDLAVDKMFDPEEAGT